MNPRALKARVDALVSKLPTRRAAALTTPELRSRIAVMLGLPDLAGLNLPVVKTTIANEIARRGAL